MRFINKLRERIKGKTFLLLTIAGVVNAFGVTLFLAPVRLYDSGISGTSLLLSQLTPEWMSLSFFLVVLNVPLFLYGTKRQGVVFTVYAVYCVLIYAIAAWVFNNLLPFDLSESSPFGGTDLVLCGIFGGLISGLGSGLAIRFGGAMDGIEVMAVIFAKKLGITIGTFTMIYNAILYITCGFVTGNWALPLYSILAYVANLKTIDYVVEGIDRSKAVLIVTSKQNEVCETLSDVFEQGMTILDAKGYYMNTTKKAVYIVLNRFQINRMKDIVHTIDPTAYITISDVADVFKANQQIK
ncbi:MAG: YitT family protein [Clostridia bacterium]|nr:YitT family protein [Clostridia bacterium]